MSQRSDAIGFFWEDHVVVREKKEAAPKRTAPNPIWTAPDWLPGYPVAAAFRPNLMTMTEFFSLPAGTELLYDVECYPNFWCVTFEVFAGPMMGKQIYFELSPWSKLDIDFLRLVYTMHTHTGFNNKNYDMVQVELAIAGLDNARLKAASDMLIAKDDLGRNMYRPYEVLKYYNIKKRLVSDNIDLIEVAPLKASLKAYAGRLHTPYMQDLPFDPSTFLTAEQAVILRYYNFKDLIHTRYLRYGIAPELMLRYEMSNTYKEDLRSRSDAQIAETVMRKELSRILGHQIKQPEPEYGVVHYWKDPGFLKFQTPELQALHETCKRIGFQIGGNGKMIIPKELEKLKIHVGTGVYSFGNGGLHSTEKKSSHIGGGRGGWRILDRDVTSYYPYLILNQGLYPKHIGPQFLVVYRGIVLQRVAAKDKAKECKEAGDKAGQARWEGIAQSLKIVINGAYGKLGSAYSCLYAPELLIQTTITGQLSIMMLIEAMVVCGIAVISANTDGVTMKVHETQYELYMEVVKWWEKVTQFATEETEYLAMYSRDVNNYVAVKREVKDGVEKKPTLKTKGQYANPWSDTSKIEPWLHINPTSQICMVAIEKLLIDHIPIHETIRGCKDMSQFISIRQVGDGGCCVVTRGDYKNRTPSEQLAVVEAKGWHMLAPGIWQFPGDSDRETYTMAEAYRQSIEPKTVDFVGKVARWYYAKGREDFEIVKVGSGNRVSESEGAMPCMDLPKEIPADLDYDWYIARTEKMLEKAGYA